MSVTPLGFCLRVIVNGKPLNPEKTTFSIPVIFNYSIVIIFEKKYL